MRDKLNKRMGIILSAIKRVRVDKKTKKLRCRGVLKEKYLERKWMHIVVGVNVSKIKI
jgi:hypothetical protein